MVARGWPRNGDRGPELRSRSFRSTRPFTIVGVGPPGFFGVKLADSGIPDFWLPLTTEPLVVGATSRLEDSRTAWLGLIGRVRRDANPKTLEAQLQVERREWLASHQSEMTAEERAGR